MRRDEASPGESRRGKTRRARTEAKEEASDEHQWQGTEGAASRKDGLADEDERREEIEGDVEACLVDEQTAKERQHDVRDAVHAVQQVVIDLKLRLVPVCVLERPVKRGRVVVAVIVAPHEKGGEREHEPPPPHG